MIEIADRSMLMLHLKMIKSAASVAFGLTHEGASTLEGNKWIEKCIGDQIQLIERHLAALRQHIKEGT